MNEYIKDHPKTTIIIVLLFMVLTRTVDVLPAVLILMFVSTFNNEHTRKVMSRFAIAYIITAIIAGFVQVYQTMGWLHFYDIENITTAFYPTAVITGLMLIVLLAMTITYLIIEARDTRCNLLIVILLMPIISAIYMVVDTAILTLLLNLNASGTADPETSSLFVVIKVGLLVYLIMKRKDESVEQLTMK